MATAKQTRIEPAQHVRIDSTVTDNAIHAPVDSHLLWDGVRVLVRLLEQARELPGAPTLPFVNHKRLAKKRARALWFTRGTDRRKPLSHDLIKTTRATLAAVATIRAQLLGAASMAWR